MQGHYFVDFLPDGGTSTTVNCAAFDGVLVDGGTWPLKVTTVESVNRAMPNAAINACRQSLIDANRLDGGP